MTIKTFKQEEVALNEGECFLLPPDKWSAKQKRMMRVVGDDRVECLYYESKNRCGVQYLGAKELQSLYPYIEYYKGLVRVKTVRYDNLLKRILK